MSYSSDQKGGTKSSGCHLEKTMGKAPSNYGNPVSKVAITFAMPKSK